MSLLIYNIYCILVPVSPMLVLVLMVRRVVAIMSVVVPVSVMVAPVASGRTFTADFALTVRTTTPTSSSMSDKNMKNFVNDYI